MRRRPTFSELSRYTGPRLVYPVRSTSLRAPASLACQPCSSDDDESDSSPRCDLSYNGPPSPCQNFPVCWNILDRRDALCSDCETSMQPLEFANHECDHQPYDNLVWQLEHHIIYNLHDLWRIHNGLCRPGDPPPMASEDVHFMKRRLKSFVRLPNGFVHWRCFRNILIAYQMVRMPEHWQLTRCPECLHHTTASCTKQQCDKCGIPEAACSLRCRGGLCSTCETDFDNHCQACESIIFHV